MTHKFYLDLSKVDREKAEQKERLRQILRPIMRGSLPPVMIGPKDWERNRSVVHMTGKKFSEIHKKLNRSVSPSTAESRHSRESARGLERPNIARRIPLPVLEPTSNRLIESRFTFNESRAFREAKKRDGLKLPDLSTQDFDRNALASVSNLAKTFAKFNREMRLPSVASPPKAAKDEPETPLQTTTILPALSKERRSTDLDSDRSRKNLRILKAKMRGVGFFMKKQKKELPVVAGTSQYDCLLPERRCNRNAQQKNGYYLASDAHRVRMQDFNDYYCEPPVRVSPKEKLTRKVKEVLKLMKVDPAKAKQLEAGGDSLGQPEQLCQDVVLQFAALHGLSLDQVDISSELFLQMASSPHADQRSARAGRPPEPADFFVVFLEVIQAALAAAGQSELRQGQDRKEKSAREAPEEEAEAGLRRVFGRSLLGHDPGRPHREVAAADQVLESVAADHRAAAGEPVAAHRGRQLLLLAVQVELA